MATGKKKQSSDRAPSVKKPALPDADVLDSDVIRAFVWNVVSIDALLEDIHQILGKHLNITQAQWLILMAISDLDRGAGVSVIDVAARLRVHPTFVTTQTKILEKMDLVTRTVSPTDARYVLMLLSDKARTSIEKLADLRARTNAALFAGLDDDLLKEITDRLSHVRKNAEQVVRRFAIENSDS